MRFKCALKLFFLATFASILHSSAFSFDETDVFSPNQNTMQLYSWIFSVQASDIISTPPNKYNVAFVENIPFDHFNAQKVDFFHIK